MLLTLLTNLGLAGSGALAPVVLVPPFYVTSAETGGGDVLSSVEIGGVTATSEDD